jgi:hypothetical protein
MTIIRTVAELTRGDFRRLKRGRCPCNPARDLRRDNADSQPQIPDRAFLDLQQDGPPLFLDHSDRGVASNRLDLVDRLAVGGKQVAGTLILIGEPALQFDKFRIKPGAVRVVENAFRLLARST